jgi:hypothetical protein
MTYSSYHVHAFPDTNGVHMVTLYGLGIYITAGKDDDGQPYVSINTEDMAPEHVYDHESDLLGTARPYEVGAERGDGSYSVMFPDPVVGHRVIARHFPQPDPVHARLAAKDHADMLNNDWSKRCGMPVIS